MANSNFQQNKRRKSKWRQKLARNLFMHYYQPYLQQPLYVIVKILPIDDILNYIISTDMHFYLDYQVMIIEISLPST